MDRRKKMIYGGAGVAVVLLVVVVVVVAWPRIKAASEPDCKPTKDKPNLRALVVSSVATDDKTTLANLVGFLDLKRDGGYLPVEVESITVTEQKDKSKLVELKAKCVVLEFSYTTGKDTAGAPTYQYTNIRMLVKNDAKPDPDNQAFIKFNEICKFDKQFSCAQPMDKRFSCQNEQIHACVSTKVGEDKPVAELVLKSMEFEFDAKPEIVEKFTFEKKPWADSCNKW